MEKMLKQIIDKLDGLETKIDKIDSNQLRMENELTEKIRGLYDFREVQNDINERIVSTLDRIEAKVDVLQLETAHIRRVK
jgi:ABC-type phosphate transport system auxiliary subunit